MAFQHTNVEIYNWILSYLDSKEGNKENFIRLKAEIKLHYGLQNNKVIDALNTLIEAEKIEEKKDGDVLYIIKL